MTTLSCASRLSALRLHRLLSSSAVRLASPFKDVVTFENVVFPPGDDYKLPEMPKKPTYDEEQGEQEYKGSRRLIESRGVELVHTDLLHRQFGLAAKTGGALYPKSFEIIRDHVNKYLRPKQFAIWRVDAPWLPRWAKPEGQKKGGGKGPIIDYVTPVKAKRIVLELGGHITELEARAYLMHLCDHFRWVQLEFVSQQLLEERRQLEPELERSNLNKFGWDMVVKYNMQDVHAWMDPYDLLWQGKYK